MAAKKTAKKAEEKAAKKAARSGSTLTRVVERLKRDLATIQEAYSFTDTVTREFLEERTDVSVSQDVSVAYAAWVRSTYGDDLDRYTQFLDKVLEGRKGQGNTLFGWDDPSTVTPSPEADRLLYRVDLGLHFVQRRLKLNLPELLRTNGGSYSIRNPVGKPREMLERVVAFVDAASDLFGAA
jgi:hypothetical protein